MANFTIGPREGRPPMYPWDVWLKKKMPFHLERGKDYKCRSYSMAIHVSRRFKNNGTPARVCVWDNDLGLTVIPGKKAGGK